MITKGMSTSRNEEMSKTTMEEDSTTTLNVTIGMADQKIPNQRTTSTRDATNEKWNVTSGTIVKAMTTNPEGTMTTKNATSATEVNQIGNHIPKATLWAEKTQTSVWGEEDQATDC